MRLGACLGLLWASTAVWGRPATTGKAVPGAEGGPASAGPGFGVVTTTTSTTLANASGNLTPAMTAVWRLDEASGTRASADANPAKALTDLDANGASTTFKMEGTAALIAPGSGTGLSNTGSSAITTPSIPFSFGCWARPAVQATAQIMDSYQGGTHTGYFLRSVGSGAWEVAVGAPAAITEALVFNFTVGQFTHIVGTVNSGNTTLRLYMNGQEWNSQTGTGLYGASTDSGPFFLSNSHGAIGGGFTGQIDECFVAPKELTAAAVCRICSCGIQGNLCSCTGTAYNVKGRNATNCASCDMTGLACDATTLP